ncbi:MAG: ABC transporter ATP-binding protein [Lachnospiraceae bacterium]|nr:ABC transporter ATP-binding protein [Lachnospiraceae bacterium]
MSKDYVIKAENLSKVYPGDGIVVEALKNASFTIYPGEFVVVLGPSGSGKSTLLNIIGGMDQPSGGELLYEGRNLTSYSRDQLSDYRREAVGFVFQFFNLIPSLTALENVELAASMGKQSEDSGEVLKWVNLAGREKHFPSQMSGGEQQRVSIARAIVKKPKLLLCDEPTGALDSKNSIDVVRILLQIRDQIGCPVVAITHNAGMAQIADRVFYMKDGQLQKIETNEHPLSVEELVW